MEKIITEVEFDGLICEGYKTKRDGTERSLEENYKNTIIGPGDYDGMGGFIEGLGRNRHYQHKY